jgi:general secretion pathway protein B
MSSILDALRKSEQERQKATGQGISQPYPATIKYEADSRLIPVLLKIIVAACIGLAIWWTGFTANDNKPVPIPPVSVSPTALQPKPVATDSEAKSLPKRMNDTHGERIAKIPQQQPATSSVESTPITAVPNRPANDPINGLPPLDVTGFIHNEQGDNMAIINDKLVKEGDEVSPGLRVEKIKDDSVIFSYKGYVFSR